MDEKFSKLLRELEEIYPQINWKRHKKIDGKLVDEIFGIYARLNRDKYSNKEEMLEKLKETYSKEE